MYKFIAIILALAITYGYCCFGVWLASMIFGFTFNHLYALGVMWLRGFFKGLINWDKVEEMDDYYIEV